MTSSKTDLSVSQTLIGGGVQIIFKISDDTSKPNAYACKNTSNPELNPAINIGLGKYLGISIYPTTKQIGLNIGLGFAPVMGVSARIDTVDHSKY